MIRNWLLILCLVIIGYLGNYYYNAKQEFAAMQGMMCVPYDQYECSIEDVQLHQCIQITKKAKPE